VTGAVTWHGRAGAVLLGPTEDRVARWLTARARRGRVLFRTMQLADELRLERSEAYRITARLRVLGLFGIANDRGGHRGGRWVWRTAIQHDGAQLDPDRHRRAWSRVLGAARSRAATVRNHISRLRGLSPRPAQDPARVPPGAGAGPTFRELFERAGGRSLLDDWGVT